MSINVTIMSINISVITEVRRFFFIIGETTLDFVWRDFEWVTLDTL